VNCNNVLCSSYNDDITARERKERMREKLLCGAVPPVQLCVLAVANRANSVVHTAR
jgi:hypothetical protein